MNTKLRKATVGLLATVAFFAAGTAYPLSIPPISTLLMGQAENPAPQPDPRADWETREVELLKLVSESVTTLSETYKDPGYDWDAIGKRVRDMIYAEVDPKAESKWPESQSAWLHASMKKLIREEKSKAGKFEQDMEKEVMLSVMAKVDAAGKPAEEEVAPDENSGEPVWKFRDKGGARTTKPRYKGQEPLN